ncbi:uncharacterized protein LTR77_007980 [Saxophila tyrrhenica]|uniref:Secondary thiamine-phosphate synthase enzyme n=1 Tax=Saxophila tyrrhenica TaxID=1690608 RepID=A0AAV9P1I6_9PEZI|nr:hypothetical protein LTR77_007980 [Saxophila tyrrhenica]
MPFDTSLRNTLIFLTIFIFAFFPTLFQLLLAPIYLPLRLLGADFSYPTPPASLYPTCACCPPASCPTPTTPIQEPPPPPTMSSAWFQKTLTLPSKSRGSYLITSTIEKELPEIKSYRVGLLHLFIQHTSCALSLNENCDPDVRTDMSDALDRVAPEDKKGDMYRHDAEGDDDMPAHIKSSLVGTSVTVPISEGRLATGTWQGIWYLEFRAMKHSRRVVATIQGEKM